MRVAVYFNLHRKTFSIRAEEGPYRGIVITHADEVALKYPDFVVSKAGRERVRRERRKNVHAFVKGELVAFQGRQALTPKGFFALPKNKWDGGWGKSIDFQVRAIRSSGKRFSYNPYEDDQFMVKYEDREDALLNAMSAVLSTYAGSFVLFPNID